MRRYYVNNEIKGTWKEEELSPIKNTIPAYARWRQNLAKP